MNSSILLFLIAIMICAGTLSPIIAEVPPFMNYQGRLTDSLGNPVPDGLYDLTFSIYNDPATATFLWQEPHAVEVISGLFNVRLGTGIPFEDLFYVNGPDLYLGIKIGAEPELFPRTPLNSSAFSMLSLLSEFALMAVAVEENTIHDMHIIDGTIQFHDIGQNFAEEGQVMKWLGGNWVPADDETGSGGDSDWIISGPDMYSGVAGNVGIGTPTPAAKLDIDFGVTGSLRAGTPLASGPGLIMFAPNGHRRDIVAGNWGISLSASPSSGAPDHSRFAIFENGTVSIRGTSLTDAESVLKVTYDSSNTSSVYAVSGFSAPEDGKGVGGLFQGGMTGVAGEVVPTGNGIYSGVYGRVLGGSGTNQAGMFEAWDGIVNYGLYSKGRWGSSAYGLYSSADNADTCYGVYAYANGIQQNYGVYATTSGTGSHAGYFEASDLSAYNSVLKVVYNDNNEIYNIYGIEGICTPADYIGTGGHFTGGNKGVVGIVEPTGTWSYIGVKGEVDGGDGTNYGVYGYGHNGDINYGVLGQGRDGSFGTGVLGASRDADTCYGVYGSASAANVFAIGVYGETSSGMPNSHAGYFTSEGLGVGGQVLKAEYTGTDFNDVVAVKGISKPQDYYGYGGYFEGGYMGVYGGVIPSGSGTYYGVNGTCSGTSTGTHYGVYGYAGGGGTNYAGYFVGDVYVSGSVTKSGSFTKIDHPLDPENMYLQHAGVESPDMKTVYDGVVVLDGNGEAEVQLPDYFEALNQDFRYQLTCIGGYSPVYISEEISYNTFRIAGGKPGMKVSWQVTGIRKDSYALTNQIAVEINKPEKERGKFLHPEAFGLSNDLRIGIIKDNDKIQSSAVENNPGGLEELNPRVKTLIDRLDEKH